MSKWNRWKKLAAYFSGAVIIMLFVLIGLIAVRFQPINPQSFGGIERLRLLAQTSQPVITAIERYHGEHNYYPAQLSELSPANDKPLFVIKGWYYQAGWAVRGNAQQYSLSMLPGPGHDPLLVFSRHADGTSQWVYDPGDDSSETPLPFSIGAKPLPVNALKGHSSSSLPHGSPPRTASSRSGK